MEKLHRQYDTITTNIEANSASEIENVQEDLSKTPSSIGMTSELKTQVQELEARLDIATEDLRRDLGGKMDNLQGTISSSISDVVHKVLNDALAAKESTITELKATLTEGDRITEKLTGDIKRATEQIENLQNRTNSIATNATMKTDKAIKEYIAAKTDLQEETRNATNELRQSKDEILDALEDKLNSKLSEFEANFPQPEDNEYKRSYKSYPDEYIINGQTVNIRTKKISRR
jgi:uncharacterized coiled-coil protein SlyX